MINKPTLAAVFTLSLALASLARPAAAADEGVDAVFVGKVSQGGRYEVEASKFAETHAKAADVKDVAVTEVHDHELVNKGLLKVAAAANIPVAPELNDTFKKRLAALSAKPPAEFDAAYIEDMQKIHDMDEKLFAKEATEGSEGFKAFAHQTDAIVKRHIGELGSN